MNSAPTHESLTPPRTLDGPEFSWPLLSIDSGAVDHNIEMMARICREHGVLHAPHVKTAMSRDLYARQVAAGAWGATVATPGQLRTVRGWGAGRIFLANQLMDPRELAWLAAELDSATSGESEPLEAWLYVDSERGANLLAAAFDGVAAPVREHLGILIEYGVTAGRTGVRTVDEALAIAQQLTSRGLPVIGVAGYEGPAATGDDKAGAVGLWFDQVLHCARTLTDAGVFTRSKPVLSVGGSAYLDVALARLASVTDEFEVLVRSGAYVVHDDGLYAQQDCFSRIPGGGELRSALRVWAQVLSAPEPGLVICGAGRRDVSFDHGLPVALMIRRMADDGSLGQPEPLRAQASSLNDQHLFLPVDPNDAPAPGDVIAFGISHPCTAMDRWDRAAVLDDRGDVTGVVPLDFP